MTTNKNFKQVINANNCPNCWGHQEYACTTVVPVISHQKNLLNSVTKDGFIRNFMVRFVDGLRINKFRK